jgi:malate dehydrogenase (oxaloacetate-decarboxylating)
LRELLDIPVFHDDQHGTATVVYAALFNALRVVGKQMKDIRVVMLGVGAAGVAISKLLLAEGVGDIIGINRHGIISKDDARLDDVRRWLATNTNKEGRVGTLADAMDGADVLIGVSGSNLVTEEHLKVMAANSIVFALANPDPEVDPVVARKYAAIVATGRSDEPNQINNVLAFPGIFRGLLDVRATKITEQIEIAAGRAIADVVKETELSANYIVPTVFNPNVVTAVAEAVEKVARASMEL